MKAKIISGLIQAGPQAGRHAVILDTDSNEYQHIIKFKEEIDEKNPKRLLLRGKEPLDQQREIIWILSNMDSRPIIEVETRGNTMPDSLIRGRVDYWCVKPDLKKNKFSDSIFQFVGNSKAYFRFDILQDGDLARAMGTMSEIGVGEEKSVMCARAKTMKKMRYLMKGLENAIGGTKMVASPYMEDLW